MVVEVKSREGLEGCFGGKWERREMSQVRMEEKEVEGA